MDQNRFQILALDGGGIKGIFSAAVLAYFESDLNINITDHFDLIVGTSTGGIIALALGIGLKPMEIVEFYIERGPLIFPRRKHAKLRRLLTNKYDFTPLKIALMEYFGKKRLSDCRKRLIIPTYNLGKDNIYLFKTPHHKRLKRDYKELLWKIAMATTAAPTYFPAFTEIENLRLIDGGVWANNPVMIGVVEAVSMLDFELKNIRVLSLGTTTEIKERKSNLNKGGVIRWGLDGVDIFLHGQNKGANSQVLHLLGDNNILRLDPIVPPELFKLDKTNSNDLLGEAANNSRQYAPKFENTFIGHMAQEYKPIYQ